jgi:hypothetical protein
MDLQDLRMDEEDDSSEEDEAEDELDPITAERRRRSKAQDRLRGKAGEPQKPVVTEVLKLQPSFLSMLRQVLAD